MLWPPGLSGSRAPAVTQRCGAHQEVPLSSGPAGPVTPAPGAEKCVNSDRARESSEFPIPERWGWAEWLCAGPPNAASSRPSPPHSTNPQGRPLPLGSGAGQADTPAGGQWRARHPAPGTRAAGNGCPPHSGPPDSICKSPIPPIPAGLVCFLNPRR